MSRFEIVSQPYWSNCLIEAVRAKIRSPNKVKIFFCKPRITENGNFQMCHFMWSDGKADYDFSDLTDSEMPWYKDFIYKGHIRKMKLGFAEKYSRYRNSI